MYSTTKIIIFDIIVKSAGTNKKKNPAFLPDSSDVYVSILEICKVLLHVGSWSDQNLLEFLLTCTCRDRMSADDIFLKTFKSIHAASDSCLAEYLCSLLE